ncbi:DUF4332 domain-containing protein [Natronolimnohabitans innermongolicus]|uniref:DUF4332 domain-containing protein n=1 Tax=Natronolimnohabitans innermongolicus JCM 12255 TaxID=1227499 RepID=L9XHF9_9EURY|nr:DUF4332 domain-containing protein [Natronolimnohabitans innermongolicus]ELY61150.1 hypothetical protein C493_02513 [Natronolimnohabitans innermongolicus JCM 12255]
MTDTEDGAAAAAEPAEAAGPTTDDAAPESEKTPDITEGEVPDDEADAEPDEPAPEPVDSIKGIGPAYADRLTAAGVETVADLAAADAADLAEQTDVSEKRIQGWIDRAEVR